MLDSEIDIVSCWIDLIPMVENQLYRFYKICSYVDKLEEDELEI